MFRLEYLSHPVGPFHMFENSLTSALTVRGEGDNLCGFAVEVVGVVGGGVAVALGLVAQHGVAPGQRLRQPRVAPGGIGGRRQAKFEQDLLFYPLDEHVLHLGLAESVSRGPRHPRPLLHHHLLVGDTLAARARRQPAVKPRLATPPLLVDGVVVIGVRVLGIFFLLIVVFLLFLCLFLAGAVALVVSVHEWHFEGVLVVVALLQLRVGGDQATGVVIVDVVAVVVVKPVALPAAFKERGLLVLFLVSLAVLLLVVMLLLLLFLLLCVWVAEG